MNSDAMHTSYTFDSAGDLHSFLSEQPLDTVIRLNVIELLDDVPSRVEATRDYVMVLIGRERIDGVSNVAAALVNNVENIQEITTNIEDIVAAATGRAQIQSLRSGMASDSKKFSWADCRGDGSNPGAIPEDEIPEGAAGAPADVPQ